MERALAERGASFELARTESVRHAVELAANAAAGEWPAVLAIGGDGIVHEVVNGLMQAAGDGETVPLGVVAVGSGNDFVKMLNMPAHDPAASVRRILAAEPRTVDVGRVSHYRGRGGPEGVWYFTNGVGLGFDAQVAREARGIRKLRGMAIYGWALVRTLRRLGAPLIQVTIDGEELIHQPLILTTVSNGPCHGGSFWLCPGASLDDGQLDILVATARPLSQVLRLIPKVMRGTHIAVEGVQLRRGRRVEIRSEDLLPIHADGEIVADWVTEIDLEVVPGQLRVLA